MSVVSLWCMVVVEHNRPCLALPDKGQTVPDTDWTPRCRRHPPDHHFEDIAIFIDDLLLPNGRGARHSGPIYGIGCHRSRQVKVCTLPAPPVGRGMRDPTLPLVRA